MLLIPLVTEQPHEEPRSPGDQRVLAGDTAAVTGQGTELLSVPGQAQPQNQAQSPFYCEFKSLKVKPDDEGRA